ncbi:MAG: metallophosphoesterase, partial [Bacteroidota bacterium]|nr:metallophosphoesterase [Bacteroidota bacterium]
MPNSRITTERQAKDYKNLGHSVLGNHIKTEATKTKIRIGQYTFPDFLNSAWISWAYHYLKSRFGPQHRFNTYHHSTDKGIYTLQSHAGADIKVALLSDWATDTKESHNIGTKIAALTPDYSIHLGDTYFVGTPEEIENNFKPGDSTWPYGTVGSFAMIGNHEMYSNGKPYFDKLLPVMGLFKPERVIQKAAYFCLENDYWRIIGIDTGFNSVGTPILEYFFSKADLPQAVVKWLKDDLKINEDKRGIIFLSHHQYASAFDTEYPAAANQLSKIIGTDRKVLWFWGHEHRFSIYGKQSRPGGVTAYGRCIGHGGMPVEIIDKVCPKCATKSNLVAFDNRVASHIGNSEVGHNGYAILNIWNENVVIEYHDEKKLLVTERWRYDKDKKQMASVSIENPGKEL